MECYTYLRNVTDLLSDGKTPYERRFGQPFKAPIVPFGSWVEYHPIIAKDQSRIHQFGKESITWIVPRICICTRGEFGRVTYWLQTLRSWKRWTHQKSTLKDSMQGNQYFPRIPTSLQTKTSSPSAPNNFAAQKCCSCPLRGGRRALWWILVTMCCTQCPPTKITLCLTPSFIGNWLTVSLQCIWWRSLLSLDTLSRPLKRGRSIVVSKRNFASFIAFDYDTELKSIAESSNKKQTRVLSDGNNISRRRMFPLPAKCHWQRCQRNPHHFFPKETDGIGWCIETCFLVFNFFQRILSGFGSIRGVASGLLRSRCFYDYFLFLVTVGLWHFAIVMHLVQ